MKIRNIEVNFDFLDGNDMERFEKEALKVKEETNKHKKENMSYSEVLKKECEILEDFFDNVFGSGTSQKLFNGKKNLREHIQIFEDIVKEKIESTKAINDIYSRYQLNRKERRNNTYHKNKGHR